MENRVVADFCVDLTEETDAHHVFLSLRKPLWFPCLRQIPLLHGHFNARHCIRCIGAAQTVQAAYDIWLEADIPDLHAWCSNDLLARRSIVRLAPPSSCLRDLWQQEILRLGAVAFTVRGSNMNYQCEVSYVCPQHCTTSGGRWHLAKGHMVHERSTTRSEVSALDKSHCIGTHRQEWWCFRYQGLHWPHCSDWKGHAGKVFKHSQPGGYAWLFVYCQATHTAYSYCSWPAWFGFHLCLHILGCVATRWTITEAPSRCSLLFDRTGWTQLPWHWFNPKRSSNILPDGTFLFLFSSILSGDSNIWLHGWALLPLPCYGARWSTNMLSTPCTVVQSRVCNTIARAFRGP